MPSERWLIHQKLGFATLLSDSDHFIRAIITSAAMPSEGVLRMGFCQDLKYGSVWSPEAQV